MKVEILTTPDCANCSVVEKMLDEMKIPYVLNFMKISVYA